MIEWHEEPKSVLLKKSNGSTLIIKKGDFINFDTRELGVKVTEFVGTNGPIGMEYLPWRGDRWATPLFGMRGNPRFIICYPIGLPHYGQHINWDTVEISVEPIL